MSVVVRAKPSDEVEDVGVAPHPRRESTEAAERLLGVAIAPLTADVTVDPGGIGPVALDRDGGEPEFPDQALRDAGSLSIELVRPVAGLAEHDDTGPADHVEQRVVVVPIAGQGKRAGPYCRDRGVVCTRSRVAGGHDQASTESGAAFATRR